MVNPLKHPLVRRVSTPIIRWMRNSTSESLGTQALAMVVFIALAAIAVGEWGEYTEGREAHFAAVVAQEKNIPLNPSIVPPIMQSAGALLCGLAVLVSLRLRRRLSQVRRSRMTLMALSVAALGGLVAYLPSDWVTNHASLFYSTIGEQQSIMAYYVKLFLISMLIISVPLVAWLHYRSSLMDQYLVGQFMAPFTFCLIGFVAIWLIFDLTDNGPNFARASADFGMIAKFYVVQLPQVILFIMPATLLLSLLYALSRMSRSNELISMLGSGRSMMRILRPLFLLGIYTSLVCLVFKYEWAPASEGYKEDMLDEINEIGKAREGKGSKKRKANRSNERFRGWMYVNEIDRRTWFVSIVPNDLYRKNLKDVAIWQFDENHKLLKSWRASSVKWFFGTREWKLINGKTYTYDSETGIPRLQSWDEMVVPGWRETPWKVVSPSQNSEYLGIPGLSTFLISNADYEDRALAPYRTNWWYCWAEPLGCLVMVLVAAPLGITYSRRGVLGGVAASIAIFATMYFIRGVLLTLGQGGYIPPFLAAWGTNLIFATVGGFLLYFRAQNREVPTLKTLYLNNFRIRPHTEKPAGPSTPASSVSA